MWCAAAKGHEKVARLHDWEGVKAYRLPFSQLLLTPRVFLFALSHRGAGVSGRGSRKLDYRTRSWTTPNWIDVRYIVRMDFMVDLHGGSCIYEGHRRGRTNEE